MCTCVGMCGVCVECECVVYESLCRFFVFLRLAFWVDSVVVNVRRFENIFGGCCREILGFFGRFGFGVVEGSCCCFFVGSRRLSSLFSCFGSCERWAFVFGSGVVFRI